MRKILISVGIALGLVLVPSVALSAGNSIVTGPNYGIGSTYTRGVTWLKVPRSPWDTGPKYVECLEMPGEHGTDALSCNWTQYNQEEK